MMTANGEEIIAKSVVRKLGSGWRAHGEKWPNACEEVQGLAGFSFCNQLMLLVRRVNLYVRKCISCNKRAMGWRPNPANSRLFVNWMRNLGENHEVSHFTRAVMGG